MDRIISRIKEIHSKSPEEYTLEDAYFISYNHGFEYRDINKSIYSIKLTRKSVCSSISSNPLFPPLSLVIVDYDRDKEEYTIYNIDHLYKKIKFTKKDEDCRLDSLIFHFADPECKVTKESIPHLKETIDLFEKLKFEKNDKYRVFTDVTSMKKINDIYIFKDYYTRTRRSIRYKKKKDTFYKFNLETSSWIKIE